MKKPMSQFVIASVMSVAAGQAAAGLISNGGFELGNTLGSSGWSVYQQLDDSDGSTNDWTQVSGAGIEVQAGGTGGMTAHSGTYKVELDSHNGVGEGLPTGTTNTIMAQEVSGLTFGDYYELSFWYSARPGTDSSTNGITAYAGTPDLFANPGALGTVTSDVVGWNQYSFTFQATATDMLVGFGADGIANTYGGYIDDVDLVSTVTPTSNVPEPGSLALLALGLMGLALSRKQQA